MNWTEYKWQQWYNKERKIHPFMFFAAVIGCVVIIAGFFAAISNKTEAYEPVCCQYKLPDAFNAKVLPSNEQGIELSAWRAISEQYESCMFQSSGEWNVTVKCKVKVLDEWGPDVDEVLMSQAQGIMVKQLGYKIDRDWSVKSNKFGNMIYTSIYSKYQEAMVNINQSNDTYFYFGRKKATQ